MTSSSLKLELREIPPNGYISPETMVACLAALPRLETFIIEFRLATPRPNQTRTMPPVTRTALSALTHFQFNGASEYLEDLAAQIDCPQLDYIRIAYLNQLVDFQVGQLSKFIDRSLGPKLTLFNRAVVTFHNNCVYTTHGRVSRSPRSFDAVYLKTFIYCKEIDWQVSHMAQVLRHFPVTLSSSVTHLHLDGQLSSLQLRGMGLAEWQPLLLQFSAVKTLYVSPELSEHLALALDDTTEATVAEVLPPLGLIWMEGQPALSIKKFIAVRQLSGRPVTVVDSSSEFIDRLGSYASE